MTAAWSRNIKIAWSVLSLNHQLLWLSSPFPNLHLREKLQPTRYGRIIGRSFCRRVLCNSRLFRGFSRLQRLEGAGGSRVGFRSIDPQKSHDGCNPSCVLDSGSRCRSTSLSERVTLFDGVVSRERDRQSFPSQQAGLDTTSRIGSFDKLD